MDKEENIEKGQSKERKARPKWNKEYVIFLVLPIILTIFFPLGGLPYLCGRFSPYAITLGHVCLLYPVIYGFIIYCFVIGVVRLSRDWRKHGRKRRLIIVAEIGIPLLFIALFVVSFFTSIEGMSFFDKPLVYGLRDRVRSKADIEAIRDWLKTLSKEDCDGNRLPREELPNSLKVLKSYRVFVYADENGNPKVRLMWGSGFLGHWGVVIGMEDMKIPPSDFRQYGEYRLPVEPGVYVWWWLE